MIFDTIENAKNYEGLNARVDRALAEAAKYTPETFTAGRIELEGSDLFLNCFAYDTCLKERAKAEAHRKYIDVMYMVEGEEIIYVKPTKKLNNITKEYNPETDIFFADLDEDVTPVRMQPGSFVVLFPQDAHAPGCCVEAPAGVKKIVGKVRIG